MSGFFDETGKGSALLHLETYNGLDGPQQYGKASTMVRRRTLSPQKRGRGRTLGDPVLVLTVVGLVSLVINRSIFV